MWELQFEKLGSGRVVAWESCGLGELRFGEDLMWGSCGVWESWCLGAAVATLSS